MPQQNKTMTTDFDLSHQCALSLDKADTLGSYRSKFEIPKGENQEEVIYLCGNSLGLMPKQTRDYLNQELDDWAKYGVEGHFHAKNPWFSYHEPLSAPMARIVGAKEKEVVVMNSLTTNLHLLMVSFYRPTPQKYKILVDYNAFPSDHYVVMSQLRFHGYGPEAIIELNPDENGIVNTQHVVETIARHKDEIALIMIGGVNYYTGQLYDINTIAKEAKKHGLTIGLDLAHAAGNIQLELHDDDIDFAAWCTYKYLNSGPGSLSGIYIHERHHGKKDIPRFEGWWGTDKENRFKMTKTFEPINSAEAWQHSNPPILSLAAIKSSLAIFDKIGMEALTAKSKVLTSYLEYLLKNIKSGKIKAVTPSIDVKRGCQLSIQINGGDRSIHDKLMANNVICDWREPANIRVAPVPLYNSFEDVYRFCKILEGIIS